MNSSKLLELPRRILLCLQQLRSSDRVGIKPAIEKQKRHQVSGAFFASFGNGLFTYLSVVYDRDPIHGLIPAFCSIYLILFSKV